MSDTKTFEDDFVQVQFDGGLIRYRCRDLLVDWPPPETLNILGFDCNRIRYSGITDEQREGMTHVCRGAEYEIKKPVDHDDEYLPEESEL